MATILRPQSEIEIPKTLFVDRSSPLLTIDWPSLYPGGYEVPLGANGETYLNVTKYRRVNVLVGPTKAHTVFLYMGKIQPNTLSAVYQWAPDRNVHTFDVVGPEIMLFLSSPFDKTTPAEKVELWLYLTS
ncbi:hypothetical protein SAMN02745126_02146 [Enhydrobacter aerosaccus]|uniref:Uncharacterized protein n=1 Tax=Enhydrobacter aerosaccus TaxID=225324 RepID=A0A1T4N7E8_9HYPH|nr:hypothetical protein [Enhydrobacter aerosaccus]SJZ75103.1 hypothetical protein SAMN02745126_02146 [Enhydrobacter aerosaccus]